MKLTTVFLFIGLMQVSANGFSQNVTLSGKDLDLKKVFELAEKQTGYYFLYKMEDLKTAGTVTFDVKDMPIEDFLRKILNGQPLQFAIRDKNIVVSSKTRLLYEVDIPVKGSVRAADGGPLAGASIRISGSSKGTVTDKDGRFTLDAKNGDVLVITFTGYLETKVTIIDGNDDMAIRLVPKESELEVVTINGGYYTTTNKTKTGNIAKVTSKDISQQPVTSPLLALQGRVAGLEISDYNGAPGFASKIRIRGQNSINRPNAAPRGYPLYVIDGIIINSMPIQTQSEQYQISGGGSGIDPLATMDPENIESIEVLKDADATAIYGSRGANGVILITTRQRRISDGIDIEGRVYTGVGKVAGHMDLLNTQQYLEMRREAIRNANGQLSVFDFDFNRWDSTRNKDWQKELLGGTANVSDLHLSLTGGSDLISYSLSAGRYKETNFISDDFGFTRNNVSLNFSHHSRDNRFTASFTAGYGNNQNNNLNVMPFLYTALTLPPHAPDLLNEDGSIKWDIIAAYGARFATFNNPMAELLRTHAYKSGTWNANANISYMAAKNVTLKVNMGYSDLNSSEIIKSPIAALSPTQIGAYSTGSSRFSYNKRSSWIIEPQLSAQKRLSGHSFDFLLGSSFQGSTDEFQQLSADGYRSDAFLESIKGAAQYYYSADESSKYRYIAFFSRLGYDWKGKYLINLTGRRDGSSRFGPGNQFGNFGAIGAAWIFSNEDILQYNPLLSFGKLRASYGTTGSDQIGDYQYYSMYNIQDGGYANFMTLVPFGLFNRDFQWEVTKKLEAAVELGFFKDRLSVQASWYRNRSSNQLIDYQLAATTGFTSVLTNFEATVENRGWEFVISSRNIISRNFRWSTSFNLSIPQNRLVAFPGIDNSPYKLQYQVGKPLSVTNRYVWTGVDPNTGKHMLTDIDQNGFIDIGDYAFGPSMERPYYGGIQNTIGYRSFELSFLFRFAKQNGTNVLNNDYPGLNRRNQPVQVMNRWQKPGDHTNVGVFTTDFMAAVIDFSNVMYSNYTIVDASFIRLESVNANYNIPYSLLKKIRLKSASLFAYGYNLLVFTNYIGLDPETGARGLPGMRKFTFGLQVKI